MLFYLFKFYIYTLSSVLKRLKLVKHKKLPLAALKDSSQKASINWESCHKNRILSFWWIACDVNKSKFCWLNVIWIPLGRFRKLHLIQFVELVQVPLFLFCLASTTKVCKQFKELSFSKKGNGAINFYLIGTERRSKGSVGVFAQCF